MPGSDEIPIADAVEQQQEAVVPVVDDEVPAEPPTDVPLEAPDADWQEQLDEVAEDPDDERVDE
ncbi:hypothetical protein [Mycobacterium sp. 1274761.0]|uniref:hypothetical protein n=1 Tax=Mycobacterium sp. 1274761.0 TaxID=1834077 RepID=UPI0007FFF5D0|nr:hypothetical protein [Mycobacterium sp. 1274761.0]OBK73269.1 hypothetical protein A5651_14080 [Mycobacterium sp. 1274761.0]